MDMSERYCSRNANDKEPLGFLLRTTTGDVLGEVAVMCKGITTGVGTLSCVGTQVVFQVSFLRKGCTAAGTGKGALFFVGAQVPLEVVVLSECSRTQVAQEGTLACVFAKVYGHFCASLGNEGALPARMQSVLYGNERMGRLAALHRQGTDEANT